MLTKRPPAFQSAGRRPPEDRYCPFFGASEARVNLLCRAIRDLAPTPPEWLRTCRSFADLPRVGAVSAGAETYPVRHLSIEGIAEHASFIVTSLTGTWTLDNAGFHFADERDALHYRAARHQPSLVAAAMAAKAANDSPVPAPLATPAALGLRPRRHLTLLK